ncbi:MAG: response regulator, partial [Proteobacteria bacterium]|nr:response regulator [Pseudomonadota bacterium]MBU4287090.1 response regulator [Pseudomonadota bacterium]MBU4414352.1 response regulator [Pseudomonadota bacterium]
TYLSPQVHDILGYKPEEAMVKWTELASDNPINEEGFQRTEKAIKTGKTQAPYELELVHKSGKIVWVEVREVPIVENGKTISIVGALTDITERKQAEEEKKKFEDQLRQAQKMEAVGRLAGSIAHDFNNILTAIIGYSNIMQIRISEDDPLQADVDQILGASQRAAQLTQSLLAFSRQQIIHPRPLRLNEIIVNIEKLLLQLIGEDIELRTMLADKNLTIMADRSQIEQVLMNLVTNARDAMPEGGLLSISTESVELDSHFIKTHGYDIKPGRYCLISVADTGIGMDEETRKKIFEPFFTTKVLGKGTGLGLSIIYGIITQHNGFIDVLSKPGKGTTFKIYLPVIKSSIEETEAETLPPPKGGTETVLVAEDDEVVRTIIKAILDRFGYKVIEAVDGEDAVTLFKKNKIDLVILDVIMPKKNGKMAFDEIKELCPEIKAIFTSGYATDLIDKKGILEEGINFIPKPVSPDDLLRKMREVLDE